MDSRYTTHTLPLDTPDDDPRWKRILDAERQGFHGGVASDEAIEQFQKDLRRDGTRLRYVTCEGTPLGADIPVATFESWDGQINVGGGRILEADFISGVTVRASHRRRGILRELMTGELAQAAGRGQSVAALTVSEGGIYGRFGFGPALRRVVVEVDPRAWKLRQPSSGRIEFLAPADLVDVAPRLHAYLLATFRGAHKAPGFVVPFDTGAFDYDAGSKDHKKLRSVVHYDEAGVIDGYVSYSMSEWGEVEAPQVNANPFVATSTRVGLELMDALVNIDMISKVNAWDLSQVMPLQMAVADPRAVRIKKYGDSNWLRILDPVVALSERGWCADGDLVIAVTDPLGYCQGAFEIHAQDGRADVVATEKDPEVELDVEALGSTYFGDYSVLTLASAGRISGNVAKMSTMWAVTDPPTNIVGF